MTKLIALYLPQYHPIPENDAWWGPGFTEWTNVAQARPLFRGHYQPRIPADLGFYDLRLAATRSEQARLAREAGVSAFCYYHYWFAGKQLLEQPFQEVVAMKEPDFPFCLCWANHTWSSATWTSQGREAQVLMEQTYPGTEDNRAHFYALLDAFRDPRYLRIDGRLVFAIYDVWRFREVTQFMAEWRELARENGLPGFYFIGMTDSTLTIDFSTGKRRLPNLQSSAEIYQQVLDMGFDAVNSFGKRRGEMLAKGRVRDIISRALGYFHLNLTTSTYSYAPTVHGYFAPEDKWENVFPTVLPQWDRTARNANHEGIYVDATPELFEQHLREAKAMIAHKHDEHQVLFLKSWNEWAEGNYVEPDRRFGHGWLDAIRRALTMLCMLFSLAFASVSQAQSVPDLSPTVLAERLDMLCLHIYTQDGQMPTCEPVYPPEGCDGVSITNNAYVNGSLTITRLRDTLYCSGEYVPDASGVSLRVRGNTSSSSTYQKKPYKLHLQKKADLLCRGGKACADKDWVLLLADDLSTYTGNLVNRLMQMPWSPASQPALLFINDDFRGLYTLCESVKRNTECRVDIQKDGFLFEYDPYWWNESFSIPSTHFRYHYTLKYPDEDDLTSAQSAFLAQRIAQVEAAYFDTLALSTQIDIPSFARWLWVHEIMGTTDYAGSNMYLSLSDGRSSTPLQMACAWDFGSARSAIDNWSSVHYVWWFAPFFELPQKSFLREYVRQYATVAKPAIAQAIDSLESLLASPQLAVLDTAIMLDSQRWWPEFADAYTQVQTYISYLQERRVWLDAAIRPISWFDPSLLSGIEEAESAAPTVRAIYSIDGRPLAHMIPGVNIVVYADGKTRKILLR